MFIFLAALSIVKFAKNAVFSVPRYRNLILGCYFIIWKSKIAFLQVTR